MVKIQSETLIKFNFSLEYATYFIEKGRAYFIWLSECEYCGVYSGINALIVSTIVGKHLLKHAINVFGLFISFG